jgi:hypothetical protein
MTLLGLLVGSNAQTGVPDCCCCCCSCCMCIPSQQQCLASHLRHDQHMLVVLLCLRSSA